MAHVLPRSLTHVRHLLLALIAIGLVLRLGAGCEAMAATPLPVAMQPHCADMPAQPEKPSKPAKVPMSVCALCAALPDTTAPRATMAMLAANDPAASMPNQLAGLTGGPAPPPPRSA